MSRILCGLHNLFWVAWTPADLRIEPPRRGALRREPGAKTRYSSLHAGGGPSAARYDDVLPPAPGLVMVRRPVARGSSSCCKIIAYEAEPESSNSILIESTR